MDRKEPLYLTPEILYRLGNGSSPLMSRIRPGEIDITEINGIKVIISNGKGISLYNKTGLDLAPLTGWVWEIGQNTKFPIGLKLIRDDSPEGHYSLCPAQNMSINEFVGLLEKVAIHCKKVFKKKA